MESPTYDLNADHESNRLQLVNLVTAIERLFAVHNKYSFDVLNKIDNVLTEEMEDSEQRLAAMIAKRQ